MSADPLSFLEEPRIFVRVYRLPQKLTDDYCFGPGVPITFTNVDWFEASLHEPRERLIEWIKGKRYFDPNARFLVLGDDPGFTFTIGEVKR